MEPTYSDGVNAVVLPRRVVLTGCGARGAFWDVGNAMSDLRFIQLCTYSWGTLDMLQLI